MLCANYQLLIANRKSLIESMVVPAWTVDVSVGDFLGGGFAHFEHHA